jgi:F1F0 ATPase subunit 2
MTDYLFAITPRNIGMLFLAAAGGVTLSVLYFGGLWFTIQKINQVKVPALLFAGSFLVRSAIVLAGFYLIAGGRLDRLAACFICFLITRHLVLKWTQPSERKDKPSHGL